jgi:hypothetical protein
MSVRLPRRRRRWRFSCRCEQCSQALLPSQRACPECGAARVPDSFVVEVRRGRGHALWHNTLRGCIVVPTAFLAAMFLVAVLAGDVAGDRGAVAFWLVATLGVVAVSSAILLAGDVARHAAAGVSTWTPHWGLSFRSIWIEERRIPTSNVEEATFSPTSDLGMPKIELRVAGRYVAHDRRHTLYLPCDLSLAEEAWRCVERQRANTAAV